MKCIPHLVLCFTAIAVSLSAAPLGVANQIGWSPTAFKTVVFSGQEAKALEGTWDLVRISDGKKVASGTVPAPKFWGPMGGDPAQVVRLPDSLPTGVYQIKNRGKVISADLVIKENAWVPLGKSLLKAFYFQRAGIAIEAKYAGPWARPVSFQSGYASYHSSTGKSTGGKDSPKGWFDAGDYNKYVVNSGITEWNLLALAENHPAFTDTLKWGIPEEGGGIPSLLAEARWNLEWMLSMQDDDGGVFHKWTAKSFNGFEPPDKDNSPRFFVGKSANASYDFAASMAQASRVWKKWDPAFSQVTLNAAIKAWSWANAHQQAIFYKNPEDVATGQYEDVDCVDEKLWASAELAATTLDAQTYFPSANWKGLKLPWWRDVGMLAAYAVVSHPSVFTSQDVKNAKMAILDLAMLYAKRVETNAWASPQVDTGSVPHTYPDLAGDFNWGSNSDLAHMGTHMLYAWYLTGESTYLRGADASLDHLLGRNPLGLSNVTGIGIKSPMNIHHRLSGSDTVKAPIPGLLVGGPYAGGNDAGWTEKENWKCVEYRTPGKVALAYVDDQCSYGTNEISINWNSALAHLAVSLTAIHDGRSFPAWSVLFIQRLSPISR
jgi:endoglucanase